MKFSPCGDRVLVRQDNPKEKTEGGIYLPNPKKPGRGKVLAVGKNVEEIQEGDIVMFQQYEATQLEIEGAELAVVREENILIVCSNRNDSED